MNPAPSSNSVRETHTHTQTRVRWLALRTTRPSYVYLDEVSDARRALEDDPLVHGDRLVSLVHLDGDVSPEEQQRERGHLGTVVQEDLRRRFD